jgi:hypothetical protein
MKVTIVGLVDAVPEVGVVGVSQLGKPDIAKLMLPLDVLSMYENDCGENGPPCGPDATMLVVGVTCSPA